MSTVEVAQVRQRLVRGMPSGSDEWVRAIAERLGLEESL